MGGISAQAQQARLDGQMAALGGKSALSNPHPLGTSHSNQWNRGYREIAEERR